MSSKTSLAQTVASNLRAEMARRGKTSNDLASLLNISQSSASRRLNGHTPIDLDDIAMICQGFEVPLSDILRTEVSA